MNFNPRAKLPQKVFKAGTWTSDTGQVHSYDSTFVQQLAENYDPDLRVANFVEGHPADNQPSYGVVASAFVDNDGWLVVVPRKMEQNFVEKVSKEQSPWSLSILPVGHPDNPIAGGPYINHVGRVPKGFQPGVKGQPHQPMQFCTSDNGVINFYMADDKPTTPEVVTPPVTPPPAVDPTQAQQFAIMQSEIEAAKAEIAAQKAELAAQKAAMINDNAAAKAENFIAKHRVKLTGSEVQLAQDTLKALYAQEATALISFTSGDKTVPLATAVEQLITNRQSLVSEGRLELENFATPEGGDEAKHLSELRERINKMHQDKLTGG